MLNLNYGPLESNFWGDYCKYDFDLWPMSQNQEWKNDFLSTTENEAPMPFQLKIILPSVYTLRQKIIDAIDTRLKTILITNGYNTDLGNDIYAWRDTPFTDPEMPALNYRDITCETSRLEAHRHRLKIEAEIKVTAGAVSMANMRKMIADVYKAIGVDPQWSGLAINTYPSKLESNIRIRESNMTMESDVIELDSTNKIVGAMIRFFIEFRTAEWNPYQ